MRHGRRSSLTLQLSLLVAAILLEVVANFAANAAASSSFAAAVQTFSGPALIVLLVVVIAGNAVVLWWDRPHGSRPVWGGDRCPFPGLGAFTEQDAAVFFGREQLTRDLVRRLHVLTGQPAARFVCVTGASGSGKSSLVHAGVVPRLRGHRWHVLPAVVPAGEPLGRLAAVASTLTGGQRQAVLRVMWADPDGLAQSIAVWRARTGNRFSRVLLIVDQLEELVTLSGSAERKLFVDQIAAALAADRRLWVLATLRVEFLADLLAGEHAELFAGPVAVGAMRPADLVEAVEQPARLAGVSFEAGLVAEIVEDTGTPDALPLLAYLLQEIYLAVGAGRVVTRQMYQASGGVAGALARQADTVLAELRGQHDPETVLSTLLRLVSMEGAEPTRRRVPLAELSAGQRQIVEVFTEARLLTSDVTAGLPVVQVAHEALFRQWAPLRQQVETRAVHLKRRAELERWAADWQRSGRSPDYLLTGDRLVLAGQWLEAMRSAGQDTPAARGLVEASRRRDTAFLRKVSEAVGHYALTNVDRFPELAVLLTTVALTECPTTPVAGRALMSALAFSHLEAVLTGHRDVVRGVAWAPDGNSIATASRDGTARLWDADTAMVTHVLHGHTGMIEAVAFSPDSTMVATASRDTTIRVWDTATAAPITVLTCGDHVRSVAWSPDGTALAGTSRDHLAHRWDTATWTKQTTLTGHAGDVWGVDWAPDSSRLATASHDRTVIVWDAITGQPAITLRGHLDLVEAVAFSPDGHWIATGSTDRTVRVWDARSGSQHRCIGGHRDAIWSLTWAPDGERLTLAAGDGTIRVWDMTRLREIAELRGHDHTAWSVAVSPDGTQVLSGSADHTARLWTLHPRGAEQAQLTGHHTAITALTAPNGGIVTGSADATVRRWHNDHRVATTHTLPAAVVALAGTLTDSTLAVALQDGTTHLLDASGSTLLLADAVEFESLTFSPDGGRLAAGAKDNTIHVFDVRTRTLAGILSGHADWIGALAWSPSGRYLASGSDDRTVRIWDMHNPSTSTVLAGHHNYVDGIAWAPDEHHLASCSADWAIRVWNLTDTTLTRELTGHDRRVRAVAYSPDGRYLASGSDDRTVRRWDTHTDYESDVIGVHRDAVTCLAWLPDGKHVVTGSTDATARFWSTEVDLDTLLHAARHRVFRTLTPDERAAHRLPAAE
ncbi:WD40 repeat domain-containing protein [Salinispora tropica]|uniref:WD40 repeat domain-containing protein n=1 Tax=Salinispora tropica TaxID=168695 RepID=UPI000491717B|nr:WD40 repeat domain-containing protein [Salinispora tropica]